MSAALPVLYERNLRSALPQVTAARRGCFILCVGRSESVRARVEEALAARLGPEKALVRGSLAARRADLWRALVEARDASGARPEETVLSFRLGGEQSEDKARLFGLNVGREVRAVERLRLLLWLDGFEQFEALRSEAPDLWAVRTDVHFYVSREDFEVSAGARAPREVTGFDKLIREIDDGLRRPGNGMRERHLLLVEKAEALLMQGHFDDALGLLDEAERMRVLNEGETHWQARWLEFDTRCHVLAKLGRSGELRRYAAAAARDAKENDETLLGLYATSQLAYALADTEAYGAALVAFLDGRRYYEQLLKDSARVIGAKDFAHTDTASAWLRLGAPACAEAEVEEIDSNVSPPDGQDITTLLVLCVRERRLASVASLRGRCNEELVHINQSYVRIVALQAWDWLDRVLHDTTNVYQRTGLLDDARAIAGEAMHRLDHTGVPLARAEWHTWFGDMARDSSDLPEATRRYELAIEALRAHAADAEQAARAMIEEARLHVKWADALPVDAAAQHRDEALRLLQDVLSRPVSDDRHMEAHLALGRLHRAAGRFDASAAALIIYRDWARADQGPARAARASIELARTSLARGDAAQALLDLAAARADLDREEPLYRSRFVQKEILVVLHDAHRALGDLAAAHAALTEALSIVRAEGLRLEELDVLQHLAELPPAAGAADHRLATAHEAAAIAREVLWPAEEARALATLAALEIEAGHPDAARAALEEATWLANSVGPASVRERVRDLAAKLEQSLAPAAVEPP
jgi:hypothetical protein